jgi:hypothetical protein
MAPAMTESALIGAARRPEPASLDGPAAGVWMAFLQPALTAVFVVAESSWGQAMLAWLV